MFNAFCTFYVQGYIQRFSLLSFISQAPTQRLKRLQCHVNIHGVRRPAKGHQQHLFTYPFHSEAREGFCRDILRREIGWSHPKLLSPYLHPEFLEENLSNEFFNDHIEGRFRPPLFIVFAFPLLFWCFSSLFPKKFNRKHLCKYAQQRLFSVIHLLLSPGFPQNRRRICISHKFHSSAKLSTLSSIE